MRKKICCIFNYNPLYRFPIFDAISKNFDCDFFFGDSVFEPLKKFDATELKGFQSYLKSRKIWRGFVWFAGIRKALKRKYNAYILTGDPYYLSNWIVILYSKLSGKKVFCWTHGLKVHSTSFVTKFFVRPFFRCMDGVLMYNRYNKQFMLPLGIKESKMHVIHNSLNTHVQTQIYNAIEPSSIYKEHFGNNNPVLIFIGRIQKRMKVGMLIDAVDILLSKGVKANIVLVGPYVDGQDLTKQVQEKGLEEFVWFYGPAYEEEITSKLLFNADVCVAPGTVGLTAIHSLSYGTPVVTHNNFGAIGPEFEAIIPGVTGDFFKENDVEDLSKTIERWVNLPIDKRSEVRRIARETIQKEWSVTYQIDVLKELFLSL